ncbi:DNA topoisomerase I [Shewanella psychrophila]|uniref:DNA topoisomerase 1 n=2 Tax=Shewanella psychrophila TaxID=225848 RepID=A0A1S6HMT0_9GAMM|nr:DNA topoisomerase I [Shewanella psychrophila]
MEPNYSILRLFGADHSMGKSLVIVESPAKAKTINKYLGKDYIVKSSVGHVRDLPTSSSPDAKVATKTPAEVRKMPPEEKAIYKSKKAKQALVARMGVDPEKDWKAKYQILPGKEKVVKELQALAEKADKIYLATDLDREGEAIAWHLQEIIGGDESRYQRVVFNEITKTAIQDAFSKPAHLDTNMVNAQQARRFLDRVVGFMVSPLLWKKVARGLSAGRVQSVATRLVVEREGEIKAFVPEEFWDIHADLNTQANDLLKMQVVKFQGKAFNPVNEKQTLEAVAALSQSSFVVAARDDRATQSKPSAPYITSTLQQAASTRLGFGVKKTMMMAQRLYEAGHITYMRTDSTNLSQEALDNVREMIGKEFGDKYLPDAPIRYGSKDGAQEAHEAIRPSDVKVHAALMSDMERDAQRLYELIWRQFVSCQMTPAKYDATRLTVKSGEYELKATGRTLRFDGWTRVQTSIKKKNEEDSTLPHVDQGDKLDLKELDPKQHFTKPSARYSEASLVKELEKRGIGRPSTYATIISTIQDRGYVRVENRRFYAEKMGEIVSESLVGSFKELMSYDFTAGMEQTLDDVAKGELEWKKVLDGFYKDLTKQIDQAELPPEDGGMRPNEMVLTDNIKCPTCERPMGIRTGTTGVFLGCSGYALPPKERCKTTMNLTPGEEAVSENSEDAETDALRAKHRCGICGTAMDSYLIDETRKLHVCGNNPICDGHEVELGQFKIKGYEGPIIECDRCGNDMELKNGRFGKYFGCTNSECKNTRKLLKSGEAAPPKEDPIHLPELKCTKSDGYFVLRDGAAGIFMAASTFPKSRETRAPLVEELVKYRELLWPKYAYLADAPVKDDDGNNASVRFSRKTKEQYVATDVDGKATGWTSKFIDGKWVTEAKKKAKPKAKAATATKAKAKAKPKAAAKTKV